MAGPFLSKWLRDLFPAHDKQTADPAAPQRLARASVTEEQQRDLAAKRRPTPEAPPPVVEQAEQPAVEEAQPAAPGSSQQLSGRDTSRPRRQR